MKSERIWSLIMLCTLVVSVQFGIAVWVINYFADWPTRGQFGDLFGVVNALFSGLAFAVLIYTMNLQRRELSLQREELKLQRQEMADSRAELAKQADAQLALFHATTAQISVASINARIEARKLLSQGSMFHEHVKEIEKYAGQLEELASQIGANHVDASDG